MMGNDEELLRLTEDPQVASEFIDAPIIDSHAVALMVW